jgi:hypothetical protein
MVVGNGAEVRMWNTDRQGRVGEERGSKETDGCPLTLWATKLFECSDFKDHVTVHP